MTMGFRRVASWGVVLAALAALGCSKREDSSGSPEAPTTPSAAGSSDVAPALGGAGVGGASGSTASSAGASSGDAGQGGSSGTGPVGQIIATRSPHRLNSVLVDGDDLYFDEVYQEGLSLFRRIMRVPKAGGAEPELIAPASIQDSSGGVPFARDSKRVYWRDEGVTYLDRTTGELGHWETVSPIAAAAGHGHLLADENVVYVSDQSCLGLSRFDKSTGTGQYYSATDAYLGGNYGVSQSETALYCSSLSGIHIWSKADMSHQVVEAIPDTKPGPCIVAGGKLLWGDDQASYTEDSLWQLGLDGTGAVRVGPLGGLGYLVAFVLHEPSNHVLTAPYGNYGVFRIDPETNAVQTIWPELLVWGDIDVDDEYLYTVSDRGRSGISYPGYIVRVPLPE